MPTPRSTKILNFLRAEGYAANVNVGEDITFKYNRLTMILNANDKDSDFYKVNLFSDLDRPQVAAARKACEEVTFNF